MDFDHSQTRRLLTAGSVTFPIQFPTMGIVSIEYGDFEVSPGRDPVRKLHVVVTEPPTLESTTTRIILARDVAAIFYETDDEESGDTFEQGHWVLGPDYDVDRISERIGQDVATQGSRLRGIAFVYRHAQVLTLSNVSKAASHYHGGPQTGYCTCECEGYGG